MSKPLAVVPFELVNAHVIIPVSINGSQPLDFVFDNASGATIVHSSTAETLGLEISMPAVVAGATGVSGDAAQVVDGPVVMEGAMAVSGDAVQVVDGQIIMEGAAAVSGDAIQVVDGQIIMDDQAAGPADGDNGMKVQVIGSSGSVVMGGQSTRAGVTVGGLTLSDVELSALPLTHLTMPSGEPIDGIIGYDILERFVVEVDYDDGLLRIFDREAYEPADQAASHAVTFLLGNMAQPCVSGEITLPDGEAVCGMFVLDTGAGVNVVLNSPFVREHDLVSKLGAAGSAPGSVSGVTPDETPIVKSTLPAFGFCGNSLDDVPVTLNQGTTGFLAGDGYAGVIGNRLLCRYNITFDYAGGLIYLDPVVGP